VKIERALAVAARARIRRRIDSALQSEQGNDIIGEADRVARCAGPFCKRPRWWPGTAAAPCLREGFTGDLLAVWRRHGRQALRQLCEENPGSYLRLIARLVENERRSSGE
jgi:hypothetical protein